MAEIVNLKRDEEMAGRAQRRAELQSDGTLAAVMTLAKNLKAMKANNPGEAATALADLQKFLGKLDSVARQVLLGDLDDDPELLADVILTPTTTDQDAMVTDTLRGKSGKGSSAPLRTVVQVSFTDCTNLS